MRKLAIIHFSPIEGYPPVLNWLNFLAGSAGEDLQVQVYTLRPGPRHPLFRPAADRIRIFRSGGEGSRKGMRDYLAYYTASLLGLIRWRPDAVLYYETLSSFPALVYKRFFSKKASLFIHYHEYVSKQEYGQGMKLSRWLHREEKRCYRLAAGISHTNADRIGLFEKDLAGSRLPELYELPNYPPASWQGAGRDHGEPALPVKIVYVGALSLDTMYTKEFAEWVLGESGKVIWDIYSDNSTAEARAWLETLDQGLVRFREAVDYYALPGVLAGYDVGVILYKGHIPNYIYNAPNKLFEYLSCGLDVWFPDVMTGIHPYVTRGTYPKVLALDFSGLSAWPLSAAISRSGLEYAPSAFDGERIFSEWLEKIKRSM